MRLPGRWEGKRLYLRHLEPGDVGPAYVRWMNDPEVVRYLESRFEPHTEQTLRAYVAKCAEDPRTLFLALVMREGDRHIGNLKLGPIDPHHRTADIGLLVGERDTWGRGHATEALEVVAANAFRELRLRKLTAGAYASNVGSVRAFQRAGFVVEGVRPAQFLRDGRPEDHILLGRLNREPIP